MKADSFRTRVEVIHKQYLSDTLSLSGNHAWVDLYTNMFHDMELYFELKCRLQRNGFYKNNENWSAREEQVQTYKDAFGEKNVFWMFLIYRMDRTVKEVKKYISKKIISREVWILPWKFIYQYECSPALYRYPKQRNFPKRMKTIWIDDVPFHYTDKRIGKLITTAKEIPF